MSVVVLPSMHKDSLLLMSHDTEFVFLVLYSCTRMSSAAWGSSQSSGDHKTSGASS